ncbi:hypothetical protein TNCV_3185721 [Trichonephila clavipes]|nr:hypothetical protein TNCV_3185721 [Trichonephila clavipes]
MPKETQGLDSLSPLHSAFIGARTHETLATDQTTRLPWPRHGLHNRFKCIIQESAKPRNFESQSRDEDDTRAGNPLYKPPYPVNVSTLSGFAARGSLVVKVTESWLACHELKPCSIEDPPCWGLMHIKYVEAQMFSRWCGIKVRRGVVPDQVLSSDHGSKLRIPSPKSLVLQNKEKLKFAQSRVVASSPDV